jgi:putative integral membrane protein (TIGR02587 family)
MSRSRRGHPPIAESLQEYGRGIGGGFLFSLPLILTMEVWSAGITVAPARLLPGLIATFVLLCGYNAYAGLHHDARLDEILVDSVEELGIGLALSAGILWMLGRIDFSTALPEALGLVLVEGLLVAVGVSVGTAQLTGGDDHSRGVPQGRQQALSSELVLAFCGAVLIAANVAPTEEILMLASEMSPALLLATLCASLALAATLLYYSNFTGSARFASTRGLPGVVRGTAITYATGFIASAALLWFFGRFDDHSLTLNIGQCVVLGLAATLGAAAGRLLLR